MKELYGRKIGFDAKRAVQNNTGLGNYSRQAIEILSEYFPDNNYYLFAPRRKENPRLANLYQRRNVSFIFPSGLHKRFASLWRMAGIKKDIVAAGVEIFHGLSNEIPLGLAKTGVKTIVTIHDLIFMRYPQFYKPIDCAIYRFKFRYACRKAHHIIAVSECTKRDIVSFFNIDANKITVIYQSCHPSFAVRVDPQCRLATVEKYGLPPQFILNVGTVESRKNLMLAVEALPHLPPTLHLVAVGKPTAYQQEVEKRAEQLGVEQRLHILNNVPFAHLPALYQAAAVFVYPSFFEGFGIPIIEALTSETPVIAAVGSCLEEAGGNHSLYIAPNDHRALARAVIQIIDNPQQANLMRAKGKEYVQRFSLQNIASALMKTYSDLLIVDC
ncbi:MAG: glycosyltransferase family 4 protein [Prevotellaceae bacterium]|jgi:glycosyltransferase involved in cell wall biosynthesis|nr:glycosyltransferase family 4 protein [Prevotellaceae bacterium]